MSVNSKMTAIADAIRNLIDISGTMGLDAMASNISSITKRGAVAGTISEKSEQYIIPSGYHNGSGTVEISPDEQSKIIAENIKNGVTILGVSGSASGEIYSVIAVTYPEGSVCTCTNGTKTLTAKDTSGKALFNVTGGEWTVSCTDGTRTASKAVSITTEGQSESVNLSYIPHLYLAGDQDTGFVPIGWAHENGGYKGEPTIKYNTDSVVFTSQSPSGWGGSAGVVYFPNKIDLTDLTTLRANATLKGALNPDNRPEGLYIWKEVGKGYYVDKAVASALFNGVGTKTLSINVSNLSGEYYIGFGLRYEGSPNETLTLKEATLE